MDCRASKAQRLYHRVQALYIIASSSQTHTCNILSHVIYFSADHVAVLEYLQNKVAGLKLHLPTTWHQDDSSPRFLDNDDSNIYNNPGRSANKLHRQFTDKIGEDSLKHIQSAVYLGAKYCVHKGFKERNTAVARDSKYLVAFTWSDGKAPKEESGTYDTWRKHTGTKIHVPISSLACVEGHKSIRSFFAKSSRNPDNSSSTSKADIGIAAQRLTDPQSCVAALGEGKPACVDSGCEMSQGSSSESSQSQTSQEPEGGVKEKATVGLKHSLDFGPSNTSIKKPKHPP